MGKVEEEATTLAPGVKVWVPDAQEAWISAEVLSMGAGDGKVKVKVGGKEKEVKESECNLQEKAIEEVRGLVCVFQLLSPTSPSHAVIRLRSSPPTPLRLPKF